MCNYVIFNVAKQEGSPILKRSGNIGEPAYCGAWRHPFCAVFWPLSLSHSSSREDLGEVVKPAPEGLSIRRCVWPVGSRAYPRSGFGFFVCTKSKVLWQDSQFAGACRCSCSKTVFAHSPAALISSRSTVSSVVVNRRYVTGCDLCFVALVKWSATLYVLNCSSVILIKFAF